MIHLSRLMPAPSERTAESLGNEPRLSGTALGTGPFIGAMFLIFLVAIILALAINFQ
jgi:hypothetical protein